jgi:hypothetical protein
MSGPQMEPTEPIVHTTVSQLHSWEEFLQRAEEFEDPNRKAWDEVWFRGQSDAQWPLNTTLERRSIKIRAVAAYFKVISEIRPTIWPAPGSVDTRLS